MPSFKESPMEAESRKAANFPDVENSLHEKFSAEGMGYIDKVTSMASEIFGDQS